MATFESKYGLNDVVWCADAHGFERDIIQEVKFGKEVNYCFKRRGDSVFLLFGNTELWVPESGLFDTEAEAKTCHERLKAKREKEEAEKKEKVRQADIIRLRAELEAAEKGIDLEEKL